MLSKRYESTEVDRRTWLHVPSGTHWSTSSDTHQVVEIQIETSTKMHTPLNLFSISLSFVMVISMFSSFVGALSFWLNSLSLIMAVGQTLFELMYHLSCFRNYIRVLDFIDRWKLLR